MDVTGRRSPRPFLGEILLKQGLVTKEQLDQALRVQAGGLRRLGYLLIKMRFISERQLLEALSQQLGIPIVRPEEEIAESVGALLPRHLCHRYTVLPLAYEENNVLRVAMVDPLDDVAIREVENFTGRAVRPVLAPLGEIQRAIPRHVAFSRQDLFNPHVAVRLAQVSAAVIALLLVAAGYLVSERVRREIFGTQSRVGASVIYKNHDLMVDVSPGGEIFFSGRGAFASGPYGVRFESPEAWAAFVGTQRGALSGKQREWLEWLRRKKISPSARGGGP